MTKSQHGPREDNPRDEQEGLLDGVVSPSSSSEVVQFQKKDAIYEHPSEGEGLGRHDGKMARASTIH